MSQTDEERDLWQTSVNEAVEKLLLQIQEQREALKALQESTTESLSKVNQQEIADLKAQLLESQSSLKELKLSIQTPPVPLTPPNPPNVEDDPKVLKTARKGPRLL